VSRVLEKYPRAVLLPFALLVLFAGAALADTKPDISDAKAGPITVDATPIRAFNRLGGTGDPPSKLAFLGGLVLTSPSNLFGGWSGLLLDDDVKSFLALSDTGVWMTGSIGYDGSRPAGIANARLGPLLQPDGKPIRRPRDRDSESIALESGTLAKGSVLIGFERRHRIVHYALTASGLSADGDALQIPPAARRMRSNQGFEAMTVMKGGPYKGRVIAFSERLYDAARNHTGWLWAGGKPETMHLKNIGDYDLTDLSSLDDGTLFVLERRFRWLEGVKMRLRRIAPDELRPGRTIEGETLIEADMNDEIDNMEGLAVTRTKPGGVLVTMISDDNFNHLLQRTLLLQFKVKDDAQAKARPPE
jgi:hypothetical protein